MFRGPTCVLCLWLAWSPTAATAKNRRLPFRRSICARIMVYHREHTPLSNPGTATT